MIVKDYLNFMDMIDKVYVGRLVFHVFDEMDKYWTTNPGLIKGQENFHSSMKRKIIDTIFSYFPELEPRKAELKPVLVEKTEAFSQEVFDRLFDIVSWYLKNPDGEHEIIVYNFHIKSEKEMIAETWETINTRTKKLSPHNEAAMYEVLINGYKNDNHFNGFVKALHKTVLSCITDVFLEIPELSSNAIRYIDNDVAFETHWFKDEFYDLIDDDLIVPYDEDGDYQ